MPAAAVAPRGLPDAAGCRCSSGCLPERYEPPGHGAGQRARARRKAATKSTADGLPAHSFQTLLGDLATLALNQVVLPTEYQTAITVSTKPTPLQRQAFDLLGVNPNQTVPITVTG